MMDEHHHPALFDDHRWAVGGAAALYASVAVLMLWVAVSRPSLQPLDDWFYDGMVSIENGATTVLAQVFNHLGGVWVTAPLRAAIAVYLWGRRRWEWFTVWLASILFSELAVTVLKALYDRPRPFDSLVETTGSAFPSGHATAGAVTAVALVIVFLPAGPHRRIWELVAAGFAFFMGLSRMYLRAHWFTDVLAGTLLGAATAIGMAAVVHMWWLRNRSEVVGDIRA
jgi:undecaprenyl-diphosphatase